ncbi:BT4734/BF3469 family protein [Gillisia sp. CAL575]|uniref:BT4734/BF3469 family protein n=1 Tax=Gillisia sp. CAL575 TaxID=985255 RepID=UPI0003A5FDAF|nr:BT4734/BF3469 family protein [Gillisia sp. CAL575]
MDNCKISYFRNCRAKTPLTATVESALHLIKSGSSKDIIEKVRQSKDQQAKDLLKQKLPGVTFGGLFNDRSTLNSGSGFACLDFDKVINLNKLKEDLINSDYIYSHWISPSGNGLKALVKIPIVKDKNEYQEYYRAILKLFKDLKPDKATKDINRLCFESYDPNLHINEESKVFRKKLKLKVSKASSIKVDSNLTEGKTIDRIVSWWVKKFPFAKGNRNNSLFVLACALSNFGINKTTTTDLFFSFEDNDFHLNEITQIIDSAYRKAEFNSQSFSR